MDMSSLLKTSAYRKDSHYISFGYGTFAPALLSPGKYKEQRRFKRVIRNSPILVLVPAHHHCMQKPHRPALFIKCFRTRSACEVNAGEGKKSWGNSDITSSCQFWDKGILDKVLIECCRNCTGSRIGVEGSDKDTLHC